MIEHSIIWAELPELQSTICDSDPLLPLELSIPQESDPQDDDLVENQSKGEEETNV